MRTDPNGNVSFTAVLPVKVSGVQRSITTTATSQINDTSEFSGGVEVPVADLSLTKSDAPNPVSVGQDLTYTLKIANNGPADSTGWGRPGQGQSEDSSEKADRAFWDVLP